MPTPRSRWPSPPALTRPIGSRTAALFAGGDGSSSPGGQGRQVAPRPARTVTVRRDSPADLVDHSLTRRSEARPGKSRIRPLTCTFFGSGGQDLNLRPLGYEPSVGLPSSKSQSGYLFYPSTASNCSARLTPARIPCRGHVRGTHSSGRQDPACEPAGDGPVACGIRAVVNGPFQRRERQPPGAS